MGKKRKKIMITAAISLLLMALLLPAESRHAMSKRKTWGKDVNGNIWRYNEKTGTLSFSGHGMLETTYAIEAKGLDYWQHRARKVVFKKGITGANNIGLDLYKCEEIIMADSMTKLGKDCISWAPKCTKIRFSKNLKELGNCALDCRGLEELNLPDSITKMDVCSLMVSEKLKKVHIPKHLEVLPMDFLDGASSLTKIRIPKCVRVIRDAAFRKTGIKEIILPKNVEELGASYKEDGGYIYHFNGIFDKCRNLEKIIIYSKKITKVRERAFHGLTKKTTIYVPEGKGKEYKKMFRRDGGLDKAVKVVEMK